RPLATGSSNALLGGSAAAARNGAAASASSNALLLMKRPGEEHRKRIDAISTSTRLRRDDAGYRFDVDFSSNIGAGKGTARSRVEARNKAVGSLAVGSFRARGFTLLELLVVVVIIGLLAGFVAPRYFGQVGKSEVATARAKIDALEKALDQYRLDVA